jgi:hypothetical protein
MVIELPLPHAPNSFDLFCIGDGVTHSGIGLPVNIPGGLPASSGGKGKFGLRGVIPAGEEVQFPKRWSNEF